MHSEIICSIKMTNCANEDFSLKINTLNNYRHHHSTLGFRNNRNAALYIQRGNQLKTSKGPPHYGSCKGKISCWLANA